MANVLDLRRRIRSVKSTRQITKAMKMIAAAKLRRAQERAVSARPYANMLASVIGSLMRHIDLYDPATGEVRHPLLLEREEKRVLLIVVSGDKGFAGAFNGNIAKAAFRFIADTADGEIDIAAIGRKGRDLWRLIQPGRDYDILRFVVAIGCSSLENRFALLDALHFDTATDGQAISLDVVVEVLHDLAQRHETVRIVSVVFGSGHPHLEVRSHQCE